MMNCFKFLDSVYGKFGFTFKLGLSTRPEKYLGEIPVWDAAEERLKAALEKFVPGKWEVNPGDGAFYGPKIDIEVQDAMRRSFQCATIQLDFNAPERFDLRYRCQPGTGNLEGGDFNRPVIIHRAILGSLERFIAILTEHFAGKWPFWLSPRQVVVIPVTNSVFGYAEEVRAALWEKGIFADADLSDNTLPKKIRNGEVGQYNFSLVVGHDEMSERSVNIRNRDNAGQKGRDEKKSLDATIKALVALKESKSLENKLDL
jgi:threonyl-tRNA synthetase